jgi:hypothetical protein
MKRECPKRLKMVKFGGKTWFIDTRLEEYRNVRNPHDRISFREAWKKW